MNGMWYIVHCIYCVEYNMAHGICALSNICEGPKVSGLPLVLGLGTRMWDRYASLVPQSETSERPRGLELSATPGRFVKTPPKLLPGGGGLMK